VHREAVDMRKQYKGLWGVVKAAMGHDVFAGDALALIGKTRKRAKVCLLAKRLEKDLREWEGQFEISKELDVESRRYVERVYLRTKYPRAIRAFLFTTMPVSKAHAGPC
jgi:hypothetical protein